MTKALLLLIGLIYSAVSSEQLTWFDGEVTFTGGKEACGRFEGPDNIVSPVNYKDGDCYFRVECISKPTDYPVMVQVCNWRVNETCSQIRHLTMVNEGDVAYWRQSVGAWWKKGSSPDWTHDATQGCWVLKGGQGTSAYNKWIDACGGSHCMGSEANNHLPITMHAWIFLTTAGEQLKLPDNVNWTCPQNWNCALATNVETVVNNRGGVHSRLNITSATCGKTMVKVNRPGSLTLFTAHGKIVHRKRLNSDRYLIPDNITGTGILLFRYTLEDGSTSNRIIYQ